MLSLIIDTALGYMGMAIAESDQILASVIVSKPVTVTALGVKTIDFLLNSTSNRKKDIGEVVVSSGPGTFTSLRVGVSLAKGLCMGLEIPIVPVSTLDAMALTTRRKDGIIVSAIDGKNNNIYVAEYSINNNTVEKILPPSLINVDNLNKNRFNFSSNIKDKQSVIIVGIEIDRYRDALQMIYPHTIAYEGLDMNQMIMALHYISSKRLYNVRPVSPIEYSPVYLREPEVKIKSKNEFVK